MAFKPRSPGQNDRIQRVRSVSRALGPVSVTSYGEPGIGSERQDIRTDLVASLAGTSVPHGDLRGISGVHEASPELRQHFTTPSDSFSSGAYDHASREIHLGGTFTGNPGTLAHEVGHHVDNSAGLLARNGAVRDRGESEAKAVNYQELHAPGHKDSYDARPPGPSYAPARRANVMPGQPFRRLGSQFGPGTADLNPEF